MRINKGLLLLLFLLLVVSSGVLANENDSKLQEFYAPRFLGAGSGTSVLLPPASSTLNPASAALAQRTTFEGSYVGILGSDDTSSGWKGHVLNFGQTLPTKVGVFTWNGSYLSSGYDSLNTGKQFSVSGSFAKDVYPDTFVGVGLKTTLGEGPSFIAAGDLGLIRTKTSLLFLDDVRWSVVLQNLGYSGIELLRPPMYNLVTGIDGRLFTHKKITGRLVGDLSWAEFDNIRLSAGINIQVGDSFHASLGTRMDLQKLLDGSTGELIPSLSLSYTYIPGEGEGEPWTQNELQPYAAVAPLSQTLWAGAFGLTIPLGRIDESPPEIKIDLSDVTERYSPEQENEPDQEGENETQKKEPSGTDNMDSVETEENVSIRHLPAFRAEEKKTGKLKPGKAGNPVGTIILVSDESGVEEKSSEKTRSEAPVSGGTTKLSELSREEIANEIPDARFYLSPNNDGRQDALSFPISISEKRYIKGYEFIVEDEAGNPVRTIENKETRPEKRTARTFFKNLFASKSGIQVPDTLRWDGSTNSGDTAPDGLYRFYLRAWDDNGNYSTTDKYTVYIDTMPPIVEIEKADEQNRIFSPNNDGNKDVLPLRQAGTREDLWRGVIENSSARVVKDFKWLDKAPEEFEWDGTNNQDILVEDGVYRYRIETTDRAGNTGKGEYGNLVKNTEPTPVGLTIDHSHFSPNGDNVLDAVLLQPDVPVKTGVSRWELDVKDEKGQIRRSYQGTTPPTGAVAFDGKDDQGRQLPEGTYFAELMVLYINGNNPKTESAPFIIDVTPPEATINIDNRIFSPNGDGVKDRITITQETSLEENWYGNITDIDGDIIYQYKWIDRADISITWDGRNEKGSLMDDGYYFYQLSTVDRAGNPGQSERKRFELNTEETEVILTTNYDYFSPDGDGVKDVIEMLPRLKGSRRVRDFSFEIFTADNESVFKREGTGDVPEYFRWDGFTGTGTRARDGKYAAVLSVTNLNGNQNSARTQAFVIDTVAPRVEVSTEHEIFSPEGDGYRDTVAFMVTDSSEEELWEGQVLNSEGDLVNSAMWNGKAEDFVWDGTDNTGNKVSDGVYSYRVFSTDRAGNFTEATGDEVVLDTKPTRLFITTNGDKLSPNGDGLYEELKFSTILNRKEGLASWKVEMTDAKGAVQRVFQGENNIPEEVIWNGENTDGRVVEGEYKAVFTAKYTKGNRPEAVSLPFKIDISAPVLSIGLNPIPFSPDNDGVDDELTIKIDVRERNKVDRWILTIFDAERSENKSAEGPVFRTYSGTGMPADRIIWDGRSNNGELVYAAMDYPYRMEVRDTFGNTAVENGKIPIDVLVIREGNLLKIKIANINFKPNEDEFVDDKPEVMARNQYVLDRLAEILKKYRQYGITIQGHANVTKFWDPELARQEQIEELMPLSTKRAERVMEALIERGVGRDRLNAEGVGGNQPIVAFDDAENRWKNRRVEFILEKE